MIPLIKQEIYLIRHGETDFNRAGIVQGSGVDSTLNERGLEQSRAFYETYRHLEFDLIVTSRLQRSIQTVEAFIQERREAWISTPLINEINWGEHEGKESTPERIAVYQRMVDAWQSGDFDASLPGGESAASLGARVEEFLQWLKSFEARRILVCSHGRTIRCMLTLFHGQSLGQMESHEHRNTGLFVIESSGLGYRVVRKNDLAHLETLAL